MALTAEEIADLVLDPRTRFARALRQRSGEEAKAVYASIEQGYMARPPGDRASCIKVAAFVHERHGEAGLIALPSVTEWLAVAELHALTAASFRAFTRSWQADMTQLIDGGDVDGALALYDRVVDGFKRVHDAYLDWFAVLLTHVYREYGIDEVETFFRYSATHTRAFVDTSIATPVEDRVRTAAYFLTANFGCLSAIDEYDDRYEVVQSSCGSCGRHGREADALRAAFDLATVTERHPLTFNRGTMPVYRTHVAVLHYLLPIEQIGVPCPAVRCPNGNVAGPCTVAIYKD